MQPAILSITAREFLRAGASQKEAHQLLDQFMLRAAVEQARGFENRAAKLLGVHRNTLWRQLKQCGLENLPRKVRAANKQMKFKFKRAPLVEFLSKAASA